MSNPTLNYNTVEMVSVYRPVPTNGAPSADDWNDSHQEILADLSTLANTWNAQIMPLVNALFATAAAGLYGTAIISDNSDTSPVFFDSIAQNPLSISDSLRVVAAAQNDLSSSLSVLQIQVQQLASRVSATSQNDIATALANFSQQLVAVQAQVAALQAAPAVAPLTNGTPTDTVLAGTVRFDSAARRLYVSTGAGWVSVGLA